MLHISHLSAKAIMISKFDLCLDDFNVKKKLDNFLYSKGNYNSFRSEISDINWESALKDLSTQESWNFFEEIIKKTIKKNTFQFVHLINLNESPYG